MFKPTKEKDAIFVDEQPVDFSNLPEGKDVEYRSKADELAGSIGAETIPGSRDFTDLSVYEKKSVLINRELE